MGTCSRVRLGLGVTCAILRGKNNVYPRQDLNL